MGTLESTSPSGYGLRLILEQAADRVSHRIQVLNSCSLVLAELQSVEGTSSDEWPPSPPLQSCSVQEIRPGQTAAFLVGMSGKSHWSASIEPVQACGELIFECACRVHSAPAWLGSTYILANDSMKDASLRYANDPSLIHWSGGELRIIPEAIGGFPPARVQSSAENCLRVTGSVELAPAGTRQTLRWRYRFAVGTSPI